MSESLLGKDFPISTLMGGLDLATAYSSMDYSAVNASQVERFNPAWYVVQTYSRCEQRVAKDLTAKGFETYLPLLRELRQWSDRKKLVETPAFSGYVFARCEPSLRSRVRVLETGGIVRMLGGNHEPSKICDEEIDSLRRTLNSGVACDRCDSFVPGAFVRVKSGPLAGVKGRLARVKNGLRLVISITVVARSVLAELGTDEVEVIHPSISLAHSTLSKV
jgi:transcription antitermination factor NusG